jgi:uncharacterized protein with NAD-binding domain and iron-sulfur cluster
MEELKNLKSYDQYVAESNEEVINIDEDSILFESDDEKEIYFEGDLYEAAAPKLTAKERKKAQEIGQLMKSS